MKTLRDNFIRIIAVLMVLFVTCESTNPIPNVNVSSLIDHLLVNYDKRLRPNLGGAPVDVEISMYVISVSAVSDDNQDVTMDFYFRTFWKDSRLAFEKKPGLESLLLGHEVSKSIWVPDLFFLQDKRESFQHTITTKNEFIKIHHSGNVTRSVRLSLTAACPMYFRSFPMDTQTCALDIESYGHNANGIKLHWKEPGRSVQISSDLYLLTHAVLGYNEKSETIVLTSGTYSRLVAEFIFKRLTGFYWRQIYIPSMFVVIISWLSFWLKRGSNERLAVCSLALLLLTIGCQLTGYDIPKTSYPKAIDVFTGVCMTFTFFALGEFLFVSRAVAEEKLEASRVDKFSRIAFPIVFVAFNAIYWTVY